MVTLKFLKKIRKKHLLWIVPLMGVFCLLAVQIFWPKDLARPFLKLGSHNIGLKNKSSISENIQDEFLKGKFELVLGEHKSQFEIASIGATVDEKSIDSQIFEYDFPQKIIPFSLFFEKSINELMLNFDEKTLNEFSQKYANEHKIEAKDSVISINEKGEIDVIKAIDGLNIDAEILAKKIKETPLKLSNINSFEVPHKIISPKITTENTQKAKLKAEQILGKSFSYKLISKDYGYEVVQKIYTPKRSEVANWFSFDQSGNLNVDDDNFKKYINELNQTLEKPAQSTVVSIVDGREKDRQEGSKGSRVSFEKMKQDLVKYLNGEYIYPSFYLEFEDINPSEQKKYSYSNTQEGLQAKVNEIGARYNVRLSLKQLNGAGWEANYRENESTPSASTYKLFVAAKLFDEMKNGRYNWDTQILGTSTRDCFYQMIILSTNACAEEWIRQFGRTNINNFAYSFGISRNTNFNSYDATRTSAIDIRRAVEKIYSGEMVSGENQRILLEHMNKQKWRSGIPAGSSGKVYDKVGFLWDYSHDVAIVEHPRGTYSLAVMTKGASFPAIAQITRELEAFMYP